MDKTEYETGTITTKDVMDAIAKNDLDRARDATNTILYNKTGEAIRQKKTEIAKSIGKQDVDGVVDYTEPSGDPINYDAGTKPTTGE